MVRYAVILVHPVYGEQDTMHNFPTKEKARAFGERERSPGGSYRLVKLNR